MCGIIGIVSHHHVVKPVFDALKRLEYRGYDSAGIATIHERAIHRRRAEGKLSNLKAILEKEPLDGRIGIGHTRWATHGIPNETNAHPHATEDVAVVHNGIIENFQELREELIGFGYTLSSQTDTEVIPHLITHYLKECKPAKEAVHSCLERLEGAFALGIVITSEPDTLFVARRGSPLAIGYGEDEHYIGSDAVALAAFTQKITYLEDGDWAEVTTNQVQIYDASGKKVERPVKSTTLSGADIGKGNYRHYMQKEIFEQPSVIGEALSAYAADGTIHLPDLSFNLKDISRITLVACGTSFYAALVARYWIERIAGVPVDVDIASEFRYREPPLAEDGLCIFISQSGETADTLAALQYAKSQHQHILAIVNVAESSMANEAENMLLTYAGPEIGVASTKAFTTQLVTLACFTLALSTAKGKTDGKTIRRFCHLLAEVPAKISEILYHQEIIEQLAHKISHAQHMLYLGRGVSYAIAYEAALKMKEISYIHAEAYAAGEMKHGPIALIDEALPVVAIVPSDELFDKTASNIQEAASRGAKIIAITDRQGEQKLRDIVWKTVRMPEVDPFVSPLLYAIPVQLLAYHTAIIKGTDVDQPRNLAKSVTVE